MMTRQMSITSTTSTTFYVVMVSEGSERDKTRVLFLYGSMSSFLSLPLLPVTLFILMVVNNWYIIMVGIARESEGEEREEGREERNR